MLLGICFAAPLVADGSFSWLVGTQCLEASRLTRAAKGYLVSHLRICLLGSTALIIWVQHALKAPPLPAPMCMSLRKWLLVAPEC